MIYIPGRLLVANSFINFQCENTPIFIKSHRIRQHKRAELFQTSTLLSAYYNATEYVLLRIKISYDPEGKNQTVSRSYTEKTKIHLLINKTMRSIDLKHEDY